MLDAIALVITTALILGNTFALAEVLDNQTLSAPDRRRWVVGIVLLPGISAALWLSRRSRYSSRQGTAPLLHSSPAALSPQDLEKFHEEIDRFRSRGG